MTNETTANYEIVKQLIKLNEQTLTGNQLRIELIERLRAIEEKLKLIYEKP